ncbi:isotrichodermin c-15 hydroxylase [Diplodia corticola]|uniref:Isotrichodermin c-15 hydroxylase n=1 Tax=Diplodia corticola TaxID=236234 RepID=A0A1J9RYQ8_9PEZI|nr:isotrichodermin c-15 hydroxylase [Diplodia corticola]OJD32581.1 isotrichodermin c-15 hydroxylase [Diplodia corticola]
MFAFNIPVVVLLGLGFYAVAKVVHALFLHPLAKIPGPPLAALCDYWVSLHWIKGTWPWDVEALHQKYGPVVRIAPNELSFCGVESIKDIYGTLNVAAPNFFPKSGTFYTQSDTTVSSVGTEVDPAKHQATRRSIAPGFSAPTLKAQSHIVIGYVNMLVEQIRKREGTPLNMTDWYMWLAFDVITDLSFGESLGNVKDGEADPWLAMLAGSGPAVAVGFVLRRRHPVVVNLARWLLTNEKSKQMRALHLEKARGMAQKRLAKVGSDEGGRADIFSHLLSAKGTTVESEWLSIQGSTLVAAGTETTSTFLSALTFYLLTHPDKLRVLQEEVRASFARREDINAESVKPLRYLQAVIEEGLRIFAPAPFGLPRVSPGATVDGVWVPKGTIVATAAHVTSRDPRYFLEPDQFHPERWLPSSYPLFDPRFGGDKKEASKPFSIGPRSCIGMQLSYMEIRLCIANLVWAFDWAQSDKNEHFIGAEVRGVDLNDISDSDIETLREAIWEHKVIVIKNQHHLDPANQVSLARRLDPTSAVRDHADWIANIHPEPEKLLKMLPIRSVPGQELVHIIGKGYVDSHYHIQNETLRGGSHDFHAKPYSRDEFEQHGRTRFHTWHMDAPFYRQQPAHFTLLRAIRLPRGPDLTVHWDDGSGSTLKVRPGATAFVSTAQLYEECLTDDEKARFERSYVEYRPFWYLWASRARGQANGIGLVSEGRELSDEEMGEIGEPRAEFRQRHPMVWVNPSTKQKHLQVHPDAAQKLVLWKGSSEEPEVIEDVEKVRRFIIDIYSRIVKPEYVFAEGPAEEGDVVVWDNCGAMHTRVDYPAHYGTRLMHQVFLNSKTAPIGPVNVASMA